MKGYAVTQRFERIEKDVIYQKGKVDDLDFLIKTNLPPHEGVFYDGQIFDAHLFVSRLVKTANQSIILISVRGDL